MAAPAYRRLQVDERRRQLLARATELFAEHGYDELSMARIAREAGISKPLLYHYFPSKQALFAAALADAAAELRELTDPDPSLPPAEQLSAALLAYLTWVGERRVAYAKLLRSQAVPEVRELVDAVRDATAQRIIEGLGPDAARSPAVLAAAHGWLWSIDGACLAWIERTPDLPPEELHRVLLGSLGGALAGAGAALPTA